MEFRLATKDDMPQVVNLIKIILDDMELPILLNNPESEVMDLFVKTFQSDTYAKLADTIVAVQDGEIAGVAFGYDGSNEEPLLAEFGNHFDAKLPKQPVFIEPEAVEKEWYLNSIAVNPKFQRQGIGSKLLNEIPHYASQRGLTKIGLLVDLANPDAERLYRRSGFKDFKTQMVSGHEYKHLQKEI